jgi:hypothetical protein
MTPEQIELLINTVGSEVIVYLESNQEEIKETEETTDLARVYEG